MDEYLSALWIHWVALMSGGLALVIGIALRISKRFWATAKSWSDIPDWLFIIVGVGCLFWAGYAAWKDKNVALLELQKRLSVPQFEGEIRVFTTTFSGTNREDTLITAAEVMIRNPLGPASAVYDWTMTVEFPDSTVITGRPIIAPQKTLTLGTIPGPGYKEILLDASQFWPRLGSQPIPPGGAPTGWFAAVFPSISDQELKSKKGILVLTFKDAVANKSHFIRRPIVASPLNAVFPEDIQQH